MLKRRKPPLGDDRRAQERRTDREQNAFAHILYWFDSLPENVASDRGTILTSLISLRKDVDQDYGPAEHVSEGSQWRVWYDSEPRRVSEVRAATDHNHQTWCLVADARVPNWSRLSTTHVVGGVDRWLNTRHC